MPHFLFQGIMEQKGISSFGFQKVLVLYWNSRSWFLRVHLKSKVIKNISNLQELYQNTQNCKALFTQRFCHYKTFFLKKTKKTKAYSKWPHWASDCFVKVFYKKTTCPRRPLLSGPKSGCLIEVWLYYIIWYSTQWLFQSCNP